MIKQDGLPNHYPTHGHDPLFWESLGRAVATFGFLEEVLLKAIFAFTATTPYAEEKIEEAYNKWVPKLTQSLSDPLGILIDTYGKSVRENPSSTIKNLDFLLDEMRKAAKIRNAICHGSWRTQDEQGQSIPFYVNRHDEIFDTPVSSAYLQQLQKATANLACCVIDTVTRMGWQFPGSSGPGQVIWQAAAE